MKSLLVMLVLVAAAVAVDLDQEWAEFKTKYNRRYGPKEDSFRRSLFEKTRQTVEEHNRQFEAGLVSYSLAVNHFADFTQEEARQHLSCLSGPGELDGASSVHVRPADAALPDAVDWRTEGAVARVKDQGLCGSCWAFGAIGALESLHFLKHGTLVELSEQNLVDCDRLDGGCDGGYPSRAYEYIRQNGVDTEASYPYDSHNGRAHNCRFKKEAVAARVSGSANISRGNEADLQHAVATVGPIAVAIDAGGVRFQNYRGGVYYEPSCSSIKLNHAVTLVGYGTDGGHDYWLVKNSWGAGWGEGGYIRMARNRNNHCGIATLAVYPLVV